MEHIISKNGSVKYNVGTLKLLTVKGTEYTISIKLHNTVNLKIKEVDI